MPSALLTFSHFPFSVVVFIDMVTYVSAYATIDVLPWYGGKFAFSLFWFNVIDQIYTKCHIFFSRAVLTSP